MALQIAKLKGASLVAGSSRHAGDRLKAFGADLSLNTDDAAWVFGKIFNQTQQATSIGGRIMNVGRLGGMVAGFDFNLHALRRLRYIGVTFRTRSRDEVREIARRVQADLWPALEAGKLRLPVDKVFPLEEAQGAHQRMRANQHFGKILLKI
jgi:NADPH:quinone reductase